MSDSHAHVQPIETTPLPLSLSLASLQGVMIERVKYGKRPVGRSYSLLKVTGMSSIQLLLTILTGTLNHSASIFHL